MVELSAYKMVFGDLDLQKRWLLKRLILQAVFIGFSTSFFIVGAYDFIIKSLLICELPYAYLAAGLGGIFIFKIFKRIQRDYGTSFSHRFIIVAYISLMFVMFYSEMDKVSVINKKALAILGFTCIIPFVNIFTLNITNS